jgi:hypothetical protein
MLAGSDQRSLSKPVRASSKFDVRLGSPGGRQSEQQMLQLHRGTVWSVLNGFEAGGLDR